MFAKKHASLTLSCGLITAIKKHLNSNAHARHTTGTKYIEITRNHMKLMVSAPSGNIITNAKTKPGKKMPILPDGPPRGSTPAITNQL